MNYQTINFNGNVYLHFYKNAKVWKTETSLVIGDVFDSHFQPVDRIEEAQIHTYYGDFFYFYLSPQEIKVYASQSAEDKLFYLKNKDGFIFAPNIEVLTTCFSPSLNWDYMMTFIKRGNLCSTYTPFKEIFQVPCGCMMAINLSNGSHQVISTWYPEIFDKEGGDWSGLFLNRLKQSLYRIFKYKKVFLELSGGLDSSLLCCLLAKAGSDITAINYYDENDPNSDERMYAKKVADYCNIPLICLPTSDCFSFNKTKFISKPNRPSVTNFYLAIDDMVHRLILSQNADYVLVSGHGADSLFLSSPPIQSVVDAFICKGCHLALRKLDEIRQFYPNPYLRDLCTCFKIYWKYLIKNKLSLPDELPRCSWLTVGENNEHDFLHPMFKKTEKKRMLPGKAFQMEILYVTLASIERQAKTIYPYLAKGVIESAFSIPTYQSYTNNFNRAWVREAFSKIAEPSLAYRKSKGSSTRAFYKGIKKNYKRIVEICMEGIFSQNNLIHKEKLYNDLNFMREGIMDKTWYIANLYCAEIYLKEWYG